MTQDTTKHNDKEGKRNKSSRELENEIGETRSAISDDIKALSDKVSPANLKHEATQALGSATDAAMNKANELTGVVVEKAVEVKDATVEKAKQVRDVAVDKANELKDAAVDTAQHAAQAASETFEEISEETRRAGRAAFRFTADNAIPLGMIGLGAGWLISNIRKDREQYRVPELPTPYRDYPADNAEYYTSMAYSDEAARPRGYTGGNSTGRKVRGAYERVERGVESAGRDAYARVEQGVRSAGQRVRETAGRSKQAVQLQAAKLRDASRDVAERNPMALAVGTLIAGIGVGLLLPTSEREDRLLEPGRQRVRRMVGQARDTAREVGGIARETAQNAADALR